MFDCIDTERNMRSGGTLCAAKISFKVYEMRWRLLRARFDTDTGQRNMNSLKWRIQLDNDTEYLSAISFIVLSFLAYF